MKIILFATLLIFFATYNSKAQKNKVTNTPKKVLIDTIPQVKIISKLKTAKELNPNNEGGELYYAIKRGNYTLADSLIKSGTNLHYVEDKGQSTLTMTILYGLYNYTIKLLDKGADPNFVGIEQHNPLQRAVIEGKFEIIKLLIEKYKADLNVKFELFGWSILHYAATYNTNEAIVDYLLKAGANPNTKNNSGETPLSIALQNRQSSGIITLLTEASNKQIQIESQKRDETIGAEVRRKDAEIIRSNTASNDVNETKINYGKYSADNVYKEEERLINYLNSSDKELNPLLGKILRSGKNTWILYKTRDRAHKILSNQISDCETFLKEYGTYTTKVFREGVETRLAQAKGTYSSF